MLEPLFTADDMLRAARGGLSDLPENRPQVRTKARASGIADCARKIAYYMSNADVTNEQPPDNDITQEQGRMMEDLSIALIERLGFRVRDRQVSLPDEYPLTGHPDGVIYRPVDVLVDRDKDPQTEWVNFDKNGLVWGFEHKHLGRWSYENIFKKGLETAEFGYLAQVVAYADALGWDAVMGVYLAQDASSTRSDARQNLSSKNPAVRWAMREDWNPKLQVYAFDMRPYKTTLAKRIRFRGEWFTKWATELGANPDEVAREADPFTEVKNIFYVENGTVQRAKGPDFPCSHCPWLNRCRETEDGKYAAPELGM